ncbi:MAG: phenylalanine--tRNA ligase beta subunit-related protein, partial [Alphaproteobacteria bacterium]|nr:phenylalanine--tRNA ligase beta subunit-related protein [Alphaproteobacteria bacterium]
MKFTLGWLKTHLETDAGIDSIAVTLTDLGLEVEEVIDRAAALAPFTVGHVLEASRHPDADRLTVCIVDTGADRVQVVCGAPNARAGMKGVFASAGVRIPGTGLDLKKSVIRGVESAGMLCSAREIGIGEDHEGIIELADDAPIGAPAAAVLGLDDPVIDVAITPNRGDCLGVHGIARDLAAAGVGALIPLAAEGIKGGFENPTGVAFDFTGETADACTLFAGRAIRGLKNGPSPDWLQQRLLSVGLRPISALVDITNFLTLDRARPLHVFDADKIAGDLTVRLARQGETLLALDGKAYELDPSMTVISDESGVLSLGGVIGALTLKAWDVYNNSSTAEIQFIVFDEDEELVINNVLNYPNPFINYTEFWFNHNSSQVLDVSVQIFTVSGKLVKTINGQTSGGSKVTSSLSKDLVWDGRDDFGDRIGKGVYVYKLTVRSNELNK